MKQYLIILALIVTGIPASAQWSVVQEYLLPRTDACGGLGSTTTVCTIGPFTTGQTGCLSSTCQAIQSGDPLTLQFGTSGDSSGCTEQTLVSVYDCTSSGGCNASNTLNTWVLHQGSPGCPTFQNVDDMDNTDCATVDPSSSGGVVGGATYITFTRSSDGACASLGTTYNGGFVELNNPGGAKLDSVASDVQTTLEDVHVMTATTVTGTDAIIQGLSSFAIESVSSPYTLQTDTGHQSLEVAVNITTGAAPTQTSLSAWPMVGSAVAWTYGAVTSSQNVSLSNFTLSNGKSQ